MAEVSVAEPAASGLETAAAARLYELHSSRVFGYCLRMLGNREEAEDAAQTTFMQAFRAIQRGVVPVFESAWLLAIARNVCHGRYRANGRRKAVELARDPHDIEALAPGADAADDALLGLREALGRLPEMQRRAFLLREWQGRSYAEIAEELDVSVSAVEALIFRARRALASDLEAGTKQRGRVFDIASLVAGLFKSFLEGSAAVKVAVGAATVVSAGAVVGGAVQMQQHDAPARQPTPPAENVRHSNSVPVTKPALRPEGRVPAAGTSEQAAPGSRTGAPRTKPKPGATTGSPAAGAPAASTPPTPAPGSPAASSPQPAPPGGGAPAPQPPAVTPPVVPAAPPPPPLELPVVSEITEQLPIQLPELPDTSELPVVGPVVEELPIVDDVLDGLPLGLGRG